MSVRVKHSDHPPLYFITFTCFEWLPLFQLTESYDTVYKWFNYLKSVRHVQVIAFVIMPNHIHCILFFPIKSFDLNLIVANAKRFMAYEIVKRLKARKESILLTRLNEAVCIKDKMKGQLHRVFKESFDAKAVYSDKFLFQKINYIHLNPVKGKYQLVVDWRQYEHSSASFYELNQVGHFKPFHYSRI